MSTTVHPHSHPLHHSTDAANLALKQQAQAETESRIQQQRMTMLWYCAGRLVFAMTFIGSAIFKWAQYSETTALLTRAGFSDEGFLVSSAIAIELIFGFALAVGYKTKAATLVLMLYVFLVAVSVQTDLNFAAASGWAGFSLAFFGGLLMLFAHGGGGFSIDGWLKIREHRRFS